MPGSAIERRRRERRWRERRRRAVCRRRAVVGALALAGLGAGVVVGSQHGIGGGTASSARIRLSRGGLGPPPALGNLVHTKAPVPVLMYHVIATPPSGAALARLYVDPDSFDREMEWLRSRGYQGVSLNQVYAAWFADGELPEKPVVISFDDGYRGQYVNARPELIKLGWPGVLNLLVRAYDPGGELTPEMVERLIGDGWELDSHTIHHIDVSTLHGADLRDEIAGSRRVLRKRFHQPVNFFCYPSGRYDAAAVAAVRAAGYLGATTTEPGLASKSERFKLKRIRIDGSDGVGGLRRKLAAAGA